MRASARILLGLGAMTAPVIGVQTWNPALAEWGFGLFGQRAIQIWTTPYFHLGDLPVTPSLLVKSLIYVALVVFAARGVRRLFRSRFLARTAMDPGLQYALEVGAGYTVIVLGLMIGLQSTGVNLSSLAIFTGVVGVGLGFGMQNLVQNFVSGLILLVERPIKVGDRVEVGDLVGDVVRIAARSTWVRTNDNVVIIVPNSEFISNRVTNWTANDRNVRLCLSLGVSYSSDPGKVREILVQVAADHPAVLSQPAPDVIFTGFGDSSLDFELRVWTAESLRTPLILKSDLYFAIFAAFREHNIEIPFPQRDLHLRSAPAKVRVLGEQE